MPVKKAETARHLPVQIPPMPVFAARLQVSEVATVEVAGMRIAESAHAWTKGREHEAREIDQPIPHDLISENEHETMMSEAMSATGLTIASSSQDVLRRQPGQRLKRE